ncbi:MULTISPECIES: hypothetical protein [Nocardia]|uniref:hypothetical protein n=1 Tax=Nocardia TaxID=1817 RepID=UPI0002F78DFB|nr:MULTISPECIES: hypothetical protein [Nocardia]
MTTIEVLTVPNCPNAPATIELLRTCLHRLHLNIPIQQRIGEYPSPTILIDGVDLMGTPPSATPTCRLDLPTKEQIMTALCRRRT